MKDDNVIRDKSFDFAVRIINLYKYLVKEKQEHIISKQILRSGTSIGANVSESEHAQSRPDFISKLSIALKEACETDYWLRLLIRTNYIEEQHAASILSDNQELIKLLTKIIKRLKDKNN